MMVIMAGSQTIKQLLENITCHFQEDTGGKLIYQACQVLSSILHLYLVVGWSYIVFNFGHSLSDFIWIFEIKF